MIARFGSGAYMNEGISEINRLLEEIVGHLKAGTTAETRKAVAKLERVAALASTLAPTIQASDGTIVDRQFPGATLGNAGGAAPNMVACALSAPPV
jgi:hypothetical protein